MDGKPSLRVDEQNQVMNLWDRLQFAMNRAVELGITKKRGAQAEMARVAGCASQAISQKKGDPNATMGAERLRRIAVWARLNVEWMVHGTGFPALDADEAAATHDSHALHGRAPNPIPMGISGSGAIPMSSVTRLSAAPRITAVGRKGEVLYRANNDWAPVELRPFFTERETSGYAKFLLVQDDDMSPELRRGDWALIDPSATPERGKLCLFLLPDDSYVIRTYEVIAGGSYEARDHMGRTLSRERHGIEYAGRLVLFQRHTD